MAPGSPFPPRSASVDRRRSDRSRPQVDDVVAPDAGKRQVRRTAFLTVGLFAALIFGIVVLANGDWMPGVTIVVASLIALGVQIPVIRKLCSTPSPTTGEATGHPQ